MGAAVTRERFVRYVQDALDHLYDLLYLQRHPLAFLLVSRPGGLGHGRILHRRLLEAIEELQPPRHAAYNSPAARKYRYLSLRYVESRTVAQICEDLGISERQSRRYHAEAVESVASVLWESYQAAPGRGADGTDRAGSQGKPAEPRATDALQAELVRVAVWPEPAPTLDRVVAAAVETVAGLAAGRATQLVANVGDDLPPVGVNGVPLRQAVISLLVYATTWARGGRVEVSGDAGAETATLRIVAMPAEPRSAPGDDGPTLGVGAAPRGRPPRTGGDQGTGHPQGGAPTDEQLRLARMLTESEAGQIDLHLDPDGALSIQLRLPVARPVVLVVDDNPEILNLFNRYLSRVYSVLEASSGPEAVQMASERRPQAITLDVMMPTQDGWQILQVLKNRDETQSIPVVVCSVLRDRELALSLGAAEFLPKPVTQPVLREALERCLRGARPGGRRG